MDSHTSTFGLIERFRQGDQDAFTSLFEKNRRRLAVLIHYKLSSEMRRHEDIDEIIQEVFLAAFQDLKQFEYRSPGSFIRWLSRIADHVITDAARFRNRQKRHAVEMVRFRSESSPEGFEPVDRHTPSRVLAEKEGLDRLLRRLDALPEQYRQVIIWAKMEGLSTQEMAELLGKSRDATSLLLHRAVQRFREIEDIQ